MGGGQQPGGGNLGHAAYHDWRMSQPGGGANTPTWATQTAPEQAAWGAAAGGNPITSPMAHAAYHDWRTAGGGTAPTWGTLSPARQAQWGAGGGDPGHAAYHDYRMAQPGGGASTPSWGQLGGYRQGQWDQAAGLKTPGTAGPAAAPWAGMPGMGGAASMTPQQGPPTGGRPMSWGGGGMGANMSPSPVGGYGGGGSFGGTGGSKG